MEPRPSEPTAAATRPAATAAAEPPLDPPGVYAVFHGLRAVPYATDSLVGHWPNSEVRVFPTTIAPAARSRRTISLSSHLGT
jgi:hypothetical protein